MPSPAASLCSRTRDPDAAARAVRGLLDRVRRPAACLVCLGGDLGASAPSLARSLAALGARIPFVLASGSAVFSERETIAREPALAALAWTGGVGSVGGLDAKSAHALQTSLHHEAGKVPSASSLLVFLDADRLRETGAEALSESFSVPIVGAGTAAGFGPIGITAEGNITDAGGVALVLRGVGAPAVARFPGFRLLTKPERVTETEGPLLVSIGKKSALELVEAVGTKGDDRPLLLVAFEPDAETASESGDPELVARPILGLDPGRGALLVSSEIRPGLRAAIAAGESPRFEDARRRTRRLFGELSGSAPRFGLYIHAGAAGDSAPGTGLSSVRDQFPSLPCAGLSALYGIRPSAARSTPRVLLEQHAGLFAVYGSPS